MTSPANSQRLSQAIRMLDAAGISYAIRTFEGAIVGVLTAQDLAPPAPPPKKKIERKHRWDQAFGYVEMLKDMRPGDVLQFDAADLVDGATTHTAECLRGSITGTASRNMPAALRSSVEGTKVKVWWPTVRDEDAPV